jgi:hypothetical protein
MPDDTKNAAGDGADIGPTDFGFHWLLAAVSPHQLSYTSFILASAPPSTWNTSVASSPATIGAGAPAGGISNFNPST